MGAIPWPAFNMRHISHKVKELRVKINKPEEEIKKKAPSERRKYLCKSPGNLACWTTVPKRICNVKSAYFPNAIQFDSLKKYSLLSIHVFSQRTFESLWFYVKSKINKIK